MTHHMRTFYALVLTQTFSLIGSRVSSLALSIWIFTQTGSATPLAMVMFFTTIPTVFASSISGVIADRWDRRKVMVLADAGQAVGTVLLLVLFLSGNLEVWHLYLVAFIQSVFSVFQGPAFMASITMLVEEKQRDRANAIQQITGPTAGFLAPIITGALYAFVGLTGAILVDLLTFVAAMIVIYFSDIPRPSVTAEGQESQGTIWREAFSGMRYVWQRPVLFSLLLHVAFVNFLLGGAGALTTAYVLLRTESEATLGLLLGLMNLGAIVGGVIMGVWGGTRPRIHTIMPAVIAVGLFMMLTGIAQDAWLLSFAMFMLMLPATMVNAAYLSVLQVKVPPDMQGRVFAFIDQISQVLMPISLLAVGPLADQVFEPAVGQAGWERVAPLVGNSAGAGMGLILVAAGGLTAIITLFVYAVPAVRQMEIILPDYVPTSTQVVTRNPTVETEGITSI